mmetsp:Transcript_20128/g.44074  ORF Transcript_20128/g.44074 Transcript_20128/m.44074 type:complete len:230 (+) Transcript_20128:235-924(+)
MMWRRYERASRPRATLVVLLATLCVGVVRAAREFGLGGGGDLAAPTCAQALKSFAAQQAKYKPPSKSVENALTYFLHVPRTGGRTFHQCFLGSAYEKSKKCPQSYDIKNFTEHESSPVFQKCQLLASHEDYSTVRPLQKFRTTAVISQLRDPVDRVISAYEFAVEVALRSAVKAPSARNANSAPTSLLQTISQGVGLGKRKVSTTNVWPWSELVPMMLEDMLQRWETGG